MSCKWVKNIILYDIFPDLYLASYKCLEASFSFLKWLFLCGPSYGILCFENMKPCVEDYVHP